MLIKEGYIDNVFENGQVYLEAWALGEDPGGLAERRYSSDGTLVSERWFPGKGPGKISGRWFNKDGTLSYELVENGDDPENWEYRFQQDVQLVS